MMSYLLALIMCHMLLTDVHLADKIMKTGWDTSGGGAQVVAGAEGLEDLIPTNRWLKRVVLPGRVDYMRMPLGASKRPTATRRVHGNLSSCTCKSVTRRTLPCSSSRLNSGR